MFYLQELFLFLSVLAIAYYCYSIYAAFDFFKQPQLIDKNFQPPVTILKPIAGLDWESYQNLASFCQQDYPQYQVVFSVQNQLDSSIQVIKRIIKDFPDQDIILEISDLALGTNLKISNIAQSINHAKYSFLLIADSDIRVGSDYLNRVIQPLKDENVGVVTCLYNSLAKGWLANFEALEIATQFSARVLTARKIEGIKFAFGSTIVIRKNLLDKIGGLNAIADYLADDYQLGNLSVKEGYQVVISDYIVEHLLAHVTIQEFLSRQSRWAKCIRVERFSGYLGLIFTQGTVFSLLFLISTHSSSLGWSILLITWTIRLLMAWIIGAVILKDTVTKKFIFWIFCRDLVSFAIWCYSLFGSDVSWRGKKFKLMKGGKIQPIIS